MRDAFHRTDLALYANGLTGREMYLQSYGVIGRSAIGQGSLEMVYKPLPDRQWQSADQLATAGPKQLLCLQAQILPNSYNLRKLHPQPRR